MKKENHKSFLCNNTNQVVLCSIALICILIYSGENDIETVQEKFTSQRIIPEITENFDWIEFSKHVKLQSRVNAVSENMKCGDLSFVEEVFLIHIPKTGGESAELLFQIPRKRHALGSSHVRLKGNREKMLTITIIRNPFDRLLSWFRYCRKGYVHEETGVLTLPDPHDTCTKAREAEPSKAGFSKWVIWTLTKRDENARWNHWFRSSIHEYIYDEETQSYLVDYIVRFENYQEDMKHVLCLLGKEEEIPHKNGWNDKITHDKFGMLLTNHYSTYYNDEAYEIAKEMFASDLSIFGYSFQNKSSSSDKF